MASTTLKSFSLISLNHSSSSKFSHTKHSSSLPCHFKGTQFSFHQSFTSNSLTLQQTRKVHPTITSSLPTANPGRGISKENAKWSARSIKAFSMGRCEARKLLYTTTGTEALLMGILVEGTSRAAYFLRTMGITLFKVRDQIVKLLGKADSDTVTPQFPPLTGPAQRALDWAVDEKLKSGESEEINATHLLLGIWTQRESAGHSVLAALGFDDEKATELAKSMEEDEMKLFKQSQYILEK